jgi:hypothetical protein
MENEKKNHESNKQHKVLRQSSVQVHDEQLRQQCITLIYQDTKYDSNE